MLAEKVETVLSRGIFNTRPRDYYDIYILGTTQNYDKKRFREALAATAEHRGSTEKIKDTDMIIKILSSSGDLQDMWVKYQKKFAYSDGITYEQIMQVLKHLIA